MRQKFGASNGLRSGSGGAMAGIGSDPSYRPGATGGSGRGGGTDINEIGANAFSFVSSWADTISKVIIRIYNFLLLACLLICLFVCLFVCLLVCLFVCLLILFIFIFYFIIIIFALYLCADNTAAGARSDSKQ